jgi:hypothetical protein
MPSNLSIVCIAMINICDLSGVNQDTHISRYGLISGFCQSGLFIIFTIDFDRYLSIINSNTESFHTEIHHHLMDTIFINSVSYVVANEKGLIWLKESSS